MKTHVDGKKCTIHVDRTDLTFSLTGRGHVQWRENNFRKLTINMFNNFVNETNSALNLSQGAQPDGTSESFSKDEGPASNSQGDTDQLITAQAHDSPIMRNISSLMDMVHTLQGQVSTLTDEINKLVQQAAESVYQTVDETHIAPSVEEVFSEAGNGEALRIDTSETDSLQGSPTSPTVIDVTPTTSRVEIQTSTPRPSKPQPPTRKQSRPAPRQQSGQRMTPTPRPRQSLRSQPRQTLLIGDSIVSGINPKGLKSSVHKHGIPGGTIDSVLRDIKVFDLKQFANIIIYIGGNDTANGTDMEYFEEKFDQLLTYIKQKNSSCKVLLVNCCPRQDVDTTTVNYIIYSLSEYHHMDLIDADHAFHNKYSEVIERYFASDYIHLSQSGLKRLLGTINSKVEIVQNFDKCGYSRSAQSSRPRSSSPLRHHRNRTRHTSRIHCNKCGETNHTTRQCRHPEQIKCNQCGFYGHKSKRCVNE